MAAGGVWILENPAGSLIEHHDAFLWLISHFRRFGMNATSLHTVLFFLCTQSQSAINVHGANYINI